MRVQLGFAVGLMAVSIGAMIDLDSDNAKRVAQVVFMASALWFKYAPV